MANRTPLFKDDKPHFHANGGGLAVGYGIYTYYAGTNTPVAMYAYPDGETQYQNPIVLNSRGEPDGQGIYADVSHNYKVILKDPTGAVVWSMDNVTPNVGVGVPMPKQAFLFNQGVDTVVNLTGGIKKLKMGSSGATVEKTDNFSINDDGDTVTGLDPEKRYMVNVSYMYDIAGTAATHHVNVNGSQWTTINFYNEFDVSSVVPEWRSMSWVITGKDSLSIWAYCSDATVSSYVELCLRDLQIVEI